MIKLSTDKHVFRVQDGDFGDAYAYVDSLLARKDVNDAMAKETLLVFEALMQKLIDWGLDENTDLEIWGRFGLGEFRIKMAFEGKVFSRDENAADSIEDQIIEAHDDKLSYSYHAGCNEITLSVSRSSRTSLFACSIAALCAVLFYLLLSYFIDAQEQTNLLNKYVFPLEIMYTNAALMIGAPMTFFSLLKNMTDTYVVSRRNSDARQLQARTLLTSVLAILLAFVGFFIVGSLLFNGMSILESPFSGSYNRTFADIVTSFIPNSIFKPFEAISPIPLIAVALLSTYALCSSGKYFDSLRHAMMTCYTLFSRMLHVVIAALPVFCFLAIMDVLLDSGPEGVLWILTYFVGIYLCFFVLFISYGIRLRANGIKVIPFLKKLGPLLRENASIGSCINATPYNIRFCARNLKMNRDMLRRNLPVLAEINLDGNCFILMFFTLAYLFFTSTGTTWLNFIGLALLVLFLSFGAPNQPGSILIGTLIILMYMQSTDLLCVAIYSEAFLGIAQNLINVFGDIVMVAIDDKKLKAQAENAENTPS